MRTLIVLGGDAPGVGLLKACAAEADFSIAADRGLEAFDAATKGLFASLSTSLLNKLLLTALDFRSDYTLLHLTSDA